MDTEEEYKKLKWVLALLVIFLFSTYYSFREFKYLIFGVTTEANVIQAFETTISRSRGRSTPVISVEYSFESDGKQISERDHLHIDSPMPSGTVSIEHIPGNENSSRIVGNRSLLPVWVFLASLCGFGYVLYGWYKEANEPVRRRK